MIPGREYRPLADRMRPVTLEQYTGQAHILGKDKPLRKAIESGHLHSMVFWGPPGTGKTTLAKIIAASCQAQFLTISAVLGGVKEIRQAIDTARVYREQSGRETVLFVDEVHRFNKSQQDSFLPHVEDGTITFIGATTENPSFELNNALLSRASVYVLQPLSDGELVDLSRRAFSNYMFIKEILDDARNAIVGYADGDARRLLNLIEQLADAAEETGRSDIDDDFVKATLTQSLRRFDKGGDQFYDQISALHKSVRASSPDAALYWMVRMLDGGADPLYLGRRIVRMASEDIGLADPRALRMALDACETYERLGSPEGELALAEVVIYLAVAPKSNAAYVAYNAARALIREDKSRPVPEHLRNAPTKLMKDLGYGANYRYAHDEAGAYAAGESYFPDGMTPPKLYEPTEFGLEAKIREKLAYLRELDRKSRK